MNFKIKSFFKAVWARIVLTRFTTAFFSFTLICCFAQGILQACQYSADTDQGRLVTAIVRPVIPPGNMSFIRGAPGDQHLQMCDDVPHILVSGQRQERYPCTTVFRSSEDTENGSRSSQIKKTRSFNWSNGLEIYTAMSLDSPTTIDGVLIYPLPENDNDAIPLSYKCVQNLSYPRQNLNNSRREDLALITIQFWLFAISLLAVVYDSVPHLVTVLVTRVFLACWSAFCVWRSMRDRDLYQEVLANPGTPCALDLFSGYFRRRVPMQIADLVLSCMGLLIFGYLTFMLLKDYGSHSFRCVGAPAHVNRINKLFLALLSVLQLEVFALTTAMSLWIDVLKNTAIGIITPLLRTYIIAFICIVAALLPWIAAGWFATKREKRWMMAIFLVLGFAMLTGWLVMFYSIVYRWTFVEWPFLGCFTVASLVLLVAGFVLGVICRTQFGKGHAEYLRAEEALSALNFTKEVFTRNEREDSFDLAPVSNNTHDRKLSLGSRNEKQQQPLSIYYIQTLEVDGSDGVGQLSGENKGPFNRV